MERLKVFLHSMDTADLFYILGFIPLLIVSYFNIFGAIIPMMGFLLLLLKKEELPIRLTANLFERALAFLVILGSFFLYYILLPFGFLSPTIPYGGPNYIMYIFGLCLLFIGLSSLRKVFTPLFLMVAASSNRLISAWLGSYLSSIVVPPLTTLVANILKVLGISLTTPFEGVIILQTWNGPLPLRIIWECVGIDSILIFSIILVVLLVEEAVETRTKLLWSFVGIFGTILVNVIRVTLIFITDYFFGFEAGARFHYTAGYVLFFAWLGFFFLIFSKRESILRKRVTINLAQTRRQT